MTAAGERGRRAGGGARAPARLPHGVGRPAGGGRWDIRPNGGSRTGRPDPIRAPGGGAGVLPLGPGARSVSSCGPASLPRGAVEATREGRLDG